MPTLRRLYVRLSTCHALSTPRRPFPSARLRQSLDRWGGSPTFSLFLLLVLGYASASYQPQARVSILLASLGAGLFLLGAALGKRHHQIQASRWQAYAWRWGLALLLLLGARLHYQQVLTETLDVSPLSTGRIELRLVGQHQLSTQEQSYDLSLPTGGRFLLRLRHRSQPELEVGDEVTVEGCRWKALQSLLTERPELGRTLLAGSYSALATGGTMRVSHVTDRELLPHPALLARRLRGRLLTRLDSLSLSSTTKHLLAGLTLGELPRDSTGKALRQTFIQGGVAHLLAVSGFHLGIIVALLASLFRHLPGLRERMRWGLTLLGAWTFALLSGASIPTLRAVAMLSLYAGARCLGRRVSFPELLTLPALIQLWLHPTSLWGASFLLTYGAMLGIYLFFRPLRKVLGGQRTTIGRYLADGLALTGAVQPIVLPLGLYLFGRVSLAFPWTSLIALPLASLLILLGGLLFLLLGLGIAPPSYFLQLLDAVASWLQAGISWTEDLPGLQVQAKLSLAGLGLYFSLLFLGLLVCRSRQR